MSQPGVQQAVDIAVAKRDIEHLTSRVDSQSRLLVETQRHSGAMIQHLADRIDRAAERSTDNAKRLTSIETRLPVYDKLEVEWAQQQSYRRVVASLLSTAATVAIITLMSLNMLGDSLGKTMLSIVGRWSGM